MALGRTLTLSMMVVTLLVAVAGRAHALYMPPADDPYATFEFKQAAADREAALRWGSHARPMADSSHSYDVLHYDAHFYIPYDVATFTCDLTITLRIHDTHVPLDFDAVGEQIDSVRLDDASTSFASTGTIMEIVTPPSDTSITHTVRVFYQGHINNVGIYKLGRTIYTMSEPEDARYWLVSYDEPMDKVTCDIWVKAPSARMSSSIGTPIDTVIAAGNTTIHWRMIYPISTYLMCFNVGDFSKISDQYIRPTPIGADTIPLTYFEHTADTAHARYDFGRVPLMIANYEAHYGKFGFDSYGMTVADNFGYGGMEHQTMTTINQGWINGTRSQELGVAHELAHQWFGDLVTCVDWRDIWLNEGFASYCEAMTAEYFSGVPSYYAWLADARGRYLDEDANRRHYAIYAPPAGYIFGTAVYKKGGWVLHMLRQEVGDSLFYLSLRTYRNAHQYADVNDFDLRTAFETVTGRDLRYFFDQWVFNPGHPRMEYWLLITPGGTTTARIHLRQTQTSAPNPFTLDHLKLRLFNAAGNDSSVYVNMPDSVLDMTVAGLGFTPDDLEINGDQRWLMADAIRTAVTEVPMAQRPRAMSLDAPWPNPTSAGTRVRFNVGMLSGPLTLGVYSLDGRRVRTLIEAPSGTGSREVTWDGRDAQGHTVSAGVYVVRLRADGKSIARTVVLTQ